jgi:hypothetical protein
MRRLASTLAGRRPFAVRGGNRNDRARKPALVEVEAEIAGLLGSDDIHPHLFAGRRQPVRPLRH